MLKTAQVVLTPVTDDDLPVMLNWINDREQAIFNAPYKPVSPRQHQEWFESVQRRSDMQLFGVRLSDTGELIGTCQLHSINKVHRSAELQIRLGQVQQRGKGYGTEAVRLLLEFAFKDLNLHRVNLHVFSTNQAAIRVYEKVGFAREGLLRSAAYINGEYVDVLVMGILQNEYAGHEGDSYPPT
jgi:RimJ/RimL family protein N-acetyltransferase